MWRKQVQKERPAQHAAKRNQAEQILVDSWEDGNQYGFLIGRIMQFCHVKDYQQQ